MRQRGRGASRFPAISRDVPRTAAARMDLAITGVTGGLPSRMIGQAARAVATRSCGLASPRLGNTGAARDEDVL